MKRFTLFFASLFMFVGIALAQQKVVSGVVVSAEDNQPIIGASVVAKGFSGVGAQTDFDGKFQFEVPANCKTLVVSYVGMTSQEVAAGSNLKIVLKSDSKALDEVVVVGYGSAKKISTTTASIVKVGAKQLEEKPIANPFDAVQGKVAGLQVYNSSGEPSKISSVRLHGSGSLGASSTPLYILDGVPVSAGFVLSMNPSDFESFQVLKDATATSIYGARAANGVIYITTKKGKAGELAQVTVRGQYGVSKLANPGYYDNLMSTQDLSDFYSQIPGYDSRFKNILDTYKKQNPNDKGFPHNTQWRKFFLRENRPTYQGDIAVSGGAGRTNYYVSAAMFSQEGLRVGSSYDKYSFRANLNSGINDAIKFGLNTAVTYDETKTSPFERNSTVGGGLAFVAPPFYSPYDAEGRPYPDVIPGWGRYNPEYVVNKNPSNNNTLGINSNGYLTIRPIRNLVLNSRIGVELMDSEGYKTTYPSYKSAKGNGTVKRTYQRDLTWTNNNTAEYKFDLFDDHHVTALIGHEYISSVYQSFAAYGEGLSDDRLTLLSATTKDKNVAEDYESTAFLSFFGQLSYDFSDKYFIDLVIRDDHSSRFGSHKQSALFGSAGLMWKMKKESFLANVDWLNDLNLKFSIGTQGNAGIGAYQSLALVERINQYKTAQGWGLGNPGNPDLSWEKQRKTTLGVNFRMFNKLGVNLELYDRLTSNMLMDIPKPYTTGVKLDDLGFASVTSNVGKYQNRGIDLRIDWDIWRNRAGDGVSSYFNFNYNADKVVSLFQGRDSWILPGYGFGYIVGQPVTFVYPIFKQVNPDNGYLEYYIPGDDIAKTTKDKVTNEFSDNLEQNTGIRRETPMVGGFGLNASYKGFYMDADFVFALGKHMISNDMFFFNNPLQFFGFNTAKSSANYWKKPGDKTILPGLEYGRKFGSALWMNFDSRMIQNASFARLKTLTLGYQFSKELLAKQNVVKGAKVYVSGRNLLTFTKFDGPDPEVDSNLSLGVNPNTMQITAGVEISF